ncbi:hypothetical protein M8J77_013807 [Diaphorina citri]|nr:hypothetical protein M8J77_013807 [Diaphorina citri]
MQNREGVDENMLGGLFNNEHSDLRGVTLGFTPEVPGSTLPTKAKSKFFGCVLVEMLQYAVELAALIGK